MPLVTTFIPNIGLEAYFSFKEPIASFLKNKYNFTSTKIKLKVVSVISMKDLIKVDKKDPFTTIYNPAGISEAEYKLDLNNSIPIVSFLFISNRGIEERFRVPLNYIAFIEDINSIKYINKLLVIDLGKIHENLDIEAHFNDLKDFIRTRIGIQPEIKQVEIGNIEVIDENEHEIREAIRTNNITVRKTLSIQLEECRNERDNLINRIQQLQQLLNN